MKTQPTPPPLGHRLLALALAVGALLTTTASGDTTGTWYKIRTNGVPQSPGSLVRGASGDLWMTSGSTNENGAWRWPAAGSLLHITGDSRENNLGQSVNMLVKPELAGKDVSYAVDDASGNTWYALENGGVRVQKADNTWVYFSATEPSPRQLADNVIRRIRFVSGGQTVLIGPLGAYVVNSSFAITQQRTGIVYNNDMINDVTLDSLGRWWVLNNRGPHRGSSLLLAEHVTGIYPSDTNVPPVESPANRIEQDVNGHLWLIVNGYGGVGIFCLNSTDVWEKYNTAAMGASNGSDCHDLVTSTNGDVWFGGRYGNGLFRFRRGSGWSRITMATLGIESYDTTSVALIGNKLWFSSGYNPSVPGNGTGVHQLLLDANGDYTSQQHFYYAETSTTVPSNRCRAVAADKSGNVWFGAYDRTSLSRRKANGTWETWSGTAGDGMTNFTINFGIVAIGVDSANIVYFATYNAPPFAYNATTDEWMSLPAAGNVGYPYGLYIDPNDNKYFYGANGAFQLSADNTTWTAFPTSGPGTGLAQQNVDYGVRVDRHGNQWFGTRGGLSMLTPGGLWTNFTGGNAGYPTGGIGYKPVLDDVGEVWTTTGLKFNYVTQTWSTPADNRVWANRNVPFANGKVFMGADNSRARGVVLNMTGSPVANLDEDMMTLGLDGTVYQGQWAFSSDLGVLAFQPPADALSISPGSRNHGAQSSTENQIAVTATRAWTATTSANWFGIVSSASGGGDGTITYALTTNANANADSRSGTITVASLDGITQTFTINQSGLVLPPSGERLANSSFDTAAGADWQIAGAANRTTMFTTPGEADMHVSGFTGKLLWQTLSVPNAGGMAFRVGAILHAGSYLAGRSVAVYLDYLDGSGAPQRLLALNPENRDITTATYFENQVTLPFDAQQLTGFSVDRQGPGEFTAESFTLTALGYAIPVVSVGQLEAIGTQPEFPLTGNYVLMSDLDAYDTAFDDDGRGFAPIGGTLATPVPFTGSFDGQNHTIRSLVINRPDFDTVGLFRTLAGRGIVRNLALKDGSITGRHDVGGFVGMNDNSTVLRCSTTTPVSGLSNAGGLVGSNHSGQIQECAGLGVVIGRDAGAGPWGACGAVAGLNMGTIRDCLGSAAVSVTNHYSAGGLAGTNLGQGIILRTFAAGLVGGVTTTNVGGLIGDASDSGFVLASFWDTETSGQAVSDGGTGRTSAQMKQQTTFTGAGWDMTSIWDIREGTTYPFLRSLVTQLVPPLLVTQEPADATGNVGGSAQFSAQAAGGLAPLTYRWQKNQVNLDEGAKFTGTTSATLTVHSLALADSGSLYRLVITDPLGASVTSEEAALTVNSAPTAVTQAATYVAATRADLAGLVNPLGLTTAVTFQWGLSATSLINTIDGTPSPLTGAMATNVSGTLFGLLPNKTYFYRVSAQNSVGTTPGSVMSFKTIAAVPPLVTTLAAINITANGATLKGKVNPRGVEAFVGFDYGLTTTYGSGFPAQPQMVNGNTETPVMAEIMGLQAHTKYNFRVHAHSDKGDANGGNLTFTTLNHTPSAEPDTYAVRPSGVVTMNVLMGDSDEDGDALSIVSFTAPPASAGRVTKVGNTLLFTAAATFPIGGTSFTYVIKDGFGGTDSATVTLTHSSATIDPLEKNIASAATSYDVTITSPGGWAVQESLVWLSVSPLNGFGNGVVTITVLPNTLKTPRPGTVTIAGIAHKVTQAGVLAPQLTVPDPIPNGIIGGTYQLVIPTVNAPVSYTATNLPKGLSIVQATGTITGRPTEVVNNKQVTIKATNAAATTPVSITFGITILPFPVAAGGTFTALIDPGDSVNQNLGGHLSFTSTTLGALSGTLKLGGTSQTITGAWEIPLVGDATAHIQIPRKGDTPLSLDLVLYLNDRIRPDAGIGGTISEQEMGGESVDLSGYRHAWPSGGSPAPYAGSYTATLGASLVPGAGNITPAGPGYLIVSITSAGVVTWSGKVADGTSVITGSSYFWPDARFPIYQSLYTGKGSVLGEPLINLPSKSLVGAVRWLKKPQLVLQYPNGIETDLVVAGNAYTQPDKGFPVLNFGNVAVGQTNAKVQFAGGDIESAAQFLKLTQLCRVTNTHTVTFSTSTTVNPTAMKITTLNAKTGFFKGSFTLKDRTPIVTRSVSFEGVLDTVIGTGTGFFLLSELPTPPATSVAKTLQRAGTVYFMPPGM